MWSAPFDSTTVSDGDHRIQVMVQGAGGNTSTDEISVVVNQSGTYQLPQRQFGPANNDIGTYADKGLLGNHTAGGPGGPAAKPAPKAGAVPKPKPQAGASSTVTLASAGSASASPSGSGG